MFHLKQIPFSVSYYNSYPCCICMELITAVPLCALPCMYTTCISMGWNSFFEKAVEERGVRVIWTPVILTGAVRLLCHCREASKLIHNSATVYFVRYALFKNISVVWRPLLHTAYDMWLSLHYLKKCTIYSQCPWHYFPAIQKLDTMFVTNQYIAQWLVLNTLKLTLLSCSDFVPIFYL